MFTLFSTLQFNTTLETVLANFDTTHTTVVESSVLPKPGDDITVVHDTLRKLRIKDSLNATYTDNETTVIIGYVSYPTKGYYVGCIITPFDKQVNIDYFIIHTDMDMNPPIFLTTERRHRGLFSILFKGGYCVYGPVEKCMLQKQCITQEGEDVNMPWYMSMPEYLISQGTKAVKSYLDTHAVKRFDAAWYLKKGNLDYKTLPSELWEDYHTSIVMNLLLRKDFTFAGKDLLINQLIIHANASQILDNTTNSINKLLEV